MIARILILIAAVVAAAIFIRYVGLLLDVALFLLVAVAALICFKRKKKPAGAQE